MKKHRDTISGFTARNVLHAIVLLTMPLSAKLLGRWPTVGWIAIVTCVALGAEILRTQRPWFDRFIRKTFGAMMRAEELKSGCGKLRLNGATWGFVGGLVTFAIFPVSVAIPSFVVLALCDPLASLVGRRYGSIKFRNGRSLQGSLAFFCAAFVIIALLTPHAIMSKLIAAAGATIAEAFEFGANDNLRIPLVTGLLILLLPASW